MPGRYCSEFGQIGARRGDDLALGHQRQRHERVIDDDRAGRQRGGALPLALALTRRLGGGRTPLFDGTGRRHRDAGQLHLRRCAGLQLQSTPSGPTRARPIATRREDRRIGHAHAPLRYAVTLTVIQLRTSVIRREDRVDRNGGITWRSGHSDRDGPCLAPWCPLQDRSGQVTGRDWAFLTQFARQRSIHSNPGLAPNLRIRRDVAGAARTGQSPPVHSKGRLHEVRTARSSRAARAGARFSPAPRWLQPQPRRAWRPQRPRPRPRPSNSDVGAVWWSELQTADPVRARAFYAAVMGWTPKVVALADQTRAPEAGEKEYTLFSSESREVAGAAQAEAAPGEHAGGAVAHLYPGRQCRSGCAEGCGTRRKAVGSAHRCP